MSRKAVVVSVANWTPRPECATLPHMSKIATAVPSSPQRPELPPCVWTDEELEALADEADAEGGEPIDGETFLQEMLAQAQAQIRAAAAAR